ncbi:MAG TPA: hypothetical protein V6C58_11335 [Allocoleopsis sp.]
MFKVLRENWFWLFWATVLISFASTLFIYWVILICVWFSLFFLFRFTKLEEQLTNIERVFYLSTILAYPIMASLIKWMIAKNIIPNSWWWLNRFEHGIWALAMVIFCLPLYTNFWRLLNWWQSLLFILGLVCLLGNLNEFAEFFTRMPPPKIKINDKIFAIYYIDTIYDMMMNILGGFIGFAILRWKHTKT